MDPNKTLEHIRRLVAKMQKDYEDPESNGIDQDEAAELTSHVEALDTWMSQGNFLPTEWQKNR